MKHQKEQTPTQQQAAPLPTGEGTGVGLSRLADGLAGGPAATLRAERRTLAALRVGHIAPSHLLGFSVMPALAFMHKNWQPCCSFCVFHSEAFTRMRPAGPVCAMLRACCAPFRDDHTSVYFINPDVPHRENPKNKQFPNP